MSEALSVGPYGPNTAGVRRFLVRLAGLGTGSRHDVVVAHSACCVRPAYQAAERLLGSTIERSGRADAQQALAGPLLQLVRLPTPVDESAVRGDDDLHSLDPIAEPALAALLALLVADLLPREILAELYAPFEPVLPLIDVWPTPEPRP